MLEPKDEIAEQLCDKGKLDEMFPQSKKRILEGPVLLLFGWEAEQ